MNIKKHNWILYLITVTIVVTIIVQLYWNYKNYKQNELHVTNEIQLSLDNAIEEYYAELTKERFFAIVEPKNPTEKDKLKKKEVWSKIFSPYKKVIPPYKEDLEDSITPQFSSYNIRTDSNKDFENMNTRFADSIFVNMTKGFSSNFKDSLSKNNSKATKFTQFFKDKKTALNIDATGIKEVKVFRGKKATDSLRLIKGLQTVFIAIQNDSLDHQKVDSILKNQLTTKGISTSFYLNHRKEDTLFFSTKKENQEVLKLTRNAKSTYLKGKEKLTLYYKNPINEALKRSFTGILLSLLLSLAIISSLFYLLKIINQQKELAEIKNDLISNITHEFKTPITTVSTAIEAIDNFNAINDKEKTKKYLSISSIQLKKLHEMVEKLLETATLDSESLLLKKEETNLVDLIQKTTNKHQLIGNKKVIFFSSNISEVVVNIDAFHFENAVSNLIDNAVKYGGNDIQVNLNVLPNTIEISVIDNGNGIEKKQQEKIFDKFYRIPKGNTHDVKGFGIGLYYTKKIIEKHGGNIMLDPNTNNTIFKIILPNE